MDRKAVMHQLTNAYRMQDLALKLQRFPSNSPEFLLLQKWMYQMNASKPPRGIDNRHVIMHIVHFLPIRLVWLSLRLVCKAWRSAIETMRFDNFIEDLEPSDLSDSERDDDERFCLHNVIKQPGAILLLSRLTKLRMWQKLDADGEKVLFESAKNLKDLRIQFYADEDIKCCKSMISTLLSLSKNSLVTLILPNCFIPCTLPNLEKLTIRLFDATVDEARRSLEKLDLQHMKEVRFEGLSRDIANFVAEHYNSYCFSANGSYSGMSFNGMLLPVKAVKTMGDLNIITEMKYPSSVEYIFAFVVNLPLGHNTYGWDQVKENLSNFPNLKEIHVRFKYKSGKWILGKKQRGIIEREIALSGVKLVEVTTRYNFWSDKYTFAKEIPFDRCRFLF